MGYIVEVFNVLTFFRIEFFHGLFMRFGMTTGELPICSGFRTLSMYYMTTNNSGSLLAKLNCRVEMRNGLSAKKKF